MHPITAAVLKAGLISPEQLREMKRISPVIDRTAEVSSPVDLELAAKIVEDALESEQYVIVRETDLEAVRQYVETATTGILHLEADDKSTDLEVTYGRTPIGEFIIAWKSEGIAEMMTNGLTYLVVPGGPGPGLLRVFFQDVRELFFGEQKAFMVCRPSTMEPHAHSS